MKIKFKTLKDHNREIQIQKWCWANNIRVYVEPSRVGRKPPVRIVLEYKGQITKGKKTFKQNTNELNEKLCEVYLWAYNRAKQAE